MKSNYYRSICIPLFILVITFASSTNNSFAQETNIVINYDTVYNKPDTIVKNVAKEVIIFDTIATYWKLELSSSFTSLQTELEGAHTLPGLSNRLNICYIINSWYTRSGIGTTAYKKPTDTYFTETNLKIDLLDIDTTILLQELVDGEIIETTIPTTITVIDSSYTSTENLRQSLNHFKYISFSVSSGYIIDKGNFSTLNGIGIQYNHLTQWNSTQVDDLLKKETTTLNKTTIGIYYENQTLYYLTSRFAIGTDFLLGYKWNSNLTTNAKINRFSWSAGVVFSFVL